MRRLSKKARAAEGINASETMAGVSEDAARALEEGLFGNDDEEAAEGKTTPDPAGAGEEIRDDDEEDDDFIEYADGERPLRRPRDTEVSVEMAEAREEADAIFGTDQEMQELLDFTRGGIGARCHCHLWAAEPCSCMCVCMSSMPLLPGPEDDHNFEIGTGEEDDYAAVDDHDEDDGFIVDDDDVHEANHNRTHSLMPPHTLLLSTGR